ncbi:MAG: hypothetical protein H5T44_00005, partial [Thermoplasmatales archaeon]|nr:hypothetical protein [Thermoplasmatales archaeon]
MKMKRKIIATGIVFLFCFASLTIAKGGEKMISYSFSVPELAIEKYDEEYIELKIDGSSYLMNDGYPVLPKISKTFEIEFGANVKSIDVFARNIEEYRIENEIRPSPPLLPLSLENAFYPKNSEFYSSNEIYPSSWYSYRIGCGLNDKMERVTFVTVHLFPVKYKPSESKIYFASNFEIKIRYDKPSKLTSSSSYDLVIISPKE